MFTIHGKANKMKNMLRGDPFKPEFVLLKKYVTYNFITNLSKFHAELKSYIFSIQLFFNLTQISEQL